MEKMGLDRVTASLILTDTDSVYFNSLGVFLEEDTTVTAYQFQKWNRELIIVYCKDRVDTSNLMNNLYKNLTCFRLCLRLQELSKEY